MPGKRIGTVGHQHVRDAHLAANIVEAFDAEPLDEFTAGHVRLGADAVGRRHLVVEDHHDLFGIGELQHLAPDMGREIGVEQHSGVDLDNRDITGDYRFSAARAGKDFFDDVLFHG